MSNKSSNINKIGNDTDTNSLGSPFRISELILKFIKGEISKEEESLLNKWIEGSEKNKELFKNCVENSANPQFIESYFADLEFMPYYRECCELIDSDNRSRRDRVARGILPALLKIAAVLLIPLLVSAIFIINGGKNELLSSKDTILPGSSSAVLVLADGEQVMLGKEVKGLARKPENIVIENDTIKYTKSAKREREYNTIIVPRGGEYVIQLSDGTKVWLNAESELRYPVSFGDGERGVYLTGEAYFQVERNESHPFTVTSGDHRITVLGTEFCVRAYKDESRILTTLEKGRVSVNSGMESVQLIPGEQSSVEGSLIKVESVDTQIYTAWRNKKYIFQEQSLGEILNTLSRWYDMRVSFDEDEFKNYRFTGELMKYSSINDFLKKLEELEKVSFKIDGRVVNVTHYRSNSL
ncbi:MAG: hypothetical protein CVU10_08230 [Bacteroidetes bacterium HGW-Bacteroidetes-5]|jgi:hypothetical protein|nr:MAG: hypothetical protein CVU10_08230 [Bacteroidetes bacterium HGW-Bacteroidetes-5]